LAVNVFSPLRVTPQAEDADLDISEHGEVFQLDRVRQDRSTTCNFFLFRRFRPLRSNMQKAL